MLNLKSEEYRWQNVLNAAFFPVDEREIFVGSSRKKSKKYKAIVKRESEKAEPFAVVTDSYRLIRHEDAMDLGYEAFERIYGDQLLDQITVFNVILSVSRGSFLADLTSESLIEVFFAKELDVVKELNAFEHHVFFLRVTNSYNRTRAVRLETGLCRESTRSCLIFGKPSIRFKDPHNKSKQQLMDFIAKNTNPLDVRRLRTEIDRAYRLDLHENRLIPAMLQTLRLVIPPVEPTPQNALSWQKKCTHLLEIAEAYEREWGLTAFSAIQASTEWVKRLMSESPIRRDSYERRCGEMLELLRSNDEWPKSDQSKSERDEQMRRVKDWAIRGRNY